VAKDIVSFLPKVADSKFLNRQENYFFVGVLFDFRFKNYSKIILKIICFLNVISLSVTCPSLERVPEGREWNNSNLEANSSLCLPTSPSKGRQIYLSNFSDSRYRFGG